MLSSSQLGILLRPVRISQIFFLLNSAAISFRISSSSTAFMLSITTASAQSSGIYERFTGTNRSNNHRNTNHRSCRSRYRRSRCHRASCRGRSSSCPSHRRSSRRYSRNHRRGRSNRDRNNPVRRSPVSSNPAQSKTEWVCLTNAGLTSLTKRTERERLTKREPSCSRRALSPSNQVP